MIDRIYNTKDLELANGDSKIPLFTYKHCPYTIYEIVILEMQYNYEDAYFTNLDQCWIHVLFVRNLIHILFQIHGQKFKH